jgi:hypothetical protein
MSIANRVVERYVAAARTPLPRDFYLPKEVRGKEPLTPEGTDLAIYTYEFSGKPYAIALLKAEDGEDGHKQG